MPPLCMDRACNKLVPMKSAKWLVFAKTVTYTVQLTSNLTITHTSLASTCKFSKTTHELDATT